MTGMPATQEDLWLRTGPVDQPLTVTYTIPLLPDPHPGWADPIDDYPTLKKSVTFQVGERTGMLGNQLGKAASYYEREVTFTMKRATELFQPAVIMVVALVVGFIAVAQVAAMYSIFGQIK